MHAILWVLAGVLTAALMYGRKESIPVFKSAVVVLFGYVSLLVWCVGHINKSIPNPFFKENPPKM